MDRRAVASGLLYLGARLVLIGGCYDLLVQAPPAHHLGFLGVSGKLDPRAATLLAGLLRALGGSLVGIGIGALLLIHRGICRGHAWAALALLLMIGAAEGVNAVQMYRVGSPYWAPLGFIGLMLLGLAFAGLRGFAGSSSILKPG